MRVIYNYFRTSPRRRTAERYRRAAVAGSTLECHATIRLSDPTYQDRGYVYPCFRERDHEGPHAYLDYDGSAYFVWKRCRHG